MANGNGYDDLQSSFGFGDALHNLFQRVAAMHGATPPPGVFAGQPPGSAGIDSNTGNFLQPPVGVSPAMAGASYAMPPAPGLGSGTPQDPYRSPYEPAPPPDTNGDTGGDALSSAMKHAQDTHDAGGDPTNALRAAQLLARSRQAQTAATQPPTQAPFSLPSWLGPGSAVGEAAGRVGRYFGLPDPGVPPGTADPFNRPWQDPNLGRPPLEATPGGRVTAGIDPATGAPQPGAPGDPTLGTQRYPGAPLGPGPAQPLIGSADPGFGRHVPPSIRGRPTWSAEGGVPYELERGPVPSRKTLLGERIPGAKYGVHLRGYPAGQTDIGPGSNIPMAALERAYRQQQMLASQGIRPSGMMYGMPPAQAKALGIRPGQPARPLTPADIPVKPPKMPTLGEAWTRVQPYLPSNATQAQRYNAAQAEHGRMMQEWDANRQTQAFNQQMELHRQQAEATREFAERKQEETEKTHETKAQQEWNKLSEKERENRVNDHVKEAKIDQLLNAIEMNDYKKQLMAHPTLPTANSLEEANALGEGTFYLTPMGALKRVPKGGRGTAVESGAAAARGESGE